MNNTKKQQIIRPRYYDSFSCVMSQCEDNCCGRIWSIPIDKKAYEKLQSIDNPQLRDKIRNCVVPVSKEHRDDFNYAEFIKTQQGQCPFFTPHGLCEIHSDMGEEFLGSTCRVYPRCHRRLIEQYSELSVSMSCPAAVRAALFNDNIMDFVIDEIDADIDNPLYTHITKPLKIEETSMYLSHAWQLREASVTIMQMRTIPVSYRIIVIALMLNDLDKLFAAGRTEEIPDVLESYKNGEYGQEFIGTLGSAPVNDVIRQKMNALIYFSVRGEAKHPQSTVFKQLIERYDIYKADNKLNQSNADDINRAAVFYSTVKKQIDLYWNNFENIYGHILENYFVSYMFTELFPVRYLENGLDVYHHTFLLAQQYAILKMSLCGNFDENEGFSDAYITKTVSQIALISQHTKKLMKIAQNYKKAGLSNPAYLFYLLI